MKSHQTALKQNIDVENVTGQILAYMSSCCRKTIEQDSPHAVVNVCVAGVNRDPGAFLVEPTRLGDKMVIPAGAKLISVDEKQTGHLEFKEARAVALSAGKHSVLRFES